MYLRSKTKPSIERCSNKIKKLREVLTSADAVLIGAGAGLSTSAGFTYTGERFEQHFLDFRRKFGITDMYTGGFYPFASQEEHWAYWSRYIEINRYMDAPKPVYSKLFELVKDKDYFVLTTNVDHQFQKAGFDQSRLFYTQGDFGLFQCSQPCCQVTYDNEQAIRAMLTEQNDMRIPTELIPVCPHCGKPMAMNLRSDARFVEDEGWHAAAARYGTFVQAHSSGRILYLELGVGYNTPGIIKLPFWQRTAQNPQATYACLNAGDAVCPDEIAGRAVCINGDIGDTFDKIHNPETVAFAL